MLLLVLGTSHDNTCKYYKFTRSISYLVIGVYIRVAVIFEGEKYWNIYFAYRSYRWKKIYKDMAEVSNLHISMFKK